MSRQQPWYGLTAAQVQTRLGTAEGGLSAAQADARRQTSGLNELPRADVVSPWQIPGEQFKNLLIIILLVAVTLSAFLGEVVEAIVIGVILMFAIGLGFVQEYRAERAMEALRRMAAPSAKVIRDGREQTLPARELVPGDRVLLAAGDRVPADVRSTEAVNLRVNEAAPTGESVGGRR